MIKSRYRYRPVTVLGPKLPAVTVLGPTLRNVTYREINVTDRYQALPYITVTCVTNVTDLHINIKSCIKKINVTQATVTLCNAW